ncbi:MAG: hypothetical protein AAGK78_13050, partial [Planctomycetota bacterium]
MIATAIPMTINRFMWAPLHRKVPGRPVNRDLRSNRKLKCPPTIGQRAREALSNFKSCDAGQPTRRTVKLRGRPLLLVKLLKGGLETFDDVVTQ